METRSRSTDDVTCLCALLEFWPRTQETKDPNSSPKVKTEESRPKDKNDEPPKRAYRPDFLLNELEAGKAVYSRQYSLNLLSGNQGGQELKVGSRIPIEMKQGEMQYLDVGPTCGRAWSLRATPWNCRRAPM